LLDVRKSSASLDDLISSLLGWLDEDQSGESNADDSHLADRTWQSFGQSILDFSSSAVELMSELLQVAREQAPKSEQATKPTGDQPDDSNTAADESEQKEPKRVSSTGSTEAIPDEQTEEQPTEKPVTTARVTESVEKSGGEAPRKSG